MFVHGYNNKIGDIMERHNLLQAGPGNAGYKGAIVSFDCRVERLSQALLLTAGCAAHAASRGDFRVGQRELLLHVFVGRVV